MALYKFRIIIIIIIIIMRVSAERSLTVLLSRQI